MGLSSERLTGAVQLNEMEVTAAVVVVVSVVAVVSVATVVSVVAVVSVTTVVSVVAVVSVVVVVSVMITGSWIVDFLPLFVLSALGPLPWALSAALVAAATLEVESKVMADAVSPPPPQPVRTSMVVKIVA